MSHQKKFVGIQIQINMWDITVNKVNKTSVALKRFAVNVIKIYLHIIEIYTNSSV